MSRRIILREREGNRGVTRATSWRRSDKKRRPVRIARAFERNRSVDYYWPLCGGCCDAGVEVSLDFGGDCVPLVDDPGAFGAGV